MKMPKIKLYLATCQCYRIIFPSNFLVFGWCSHSVKKKCNKLNSLDSGRHKPI